MDYSVKKINSSSSNIEELNIKHIICGGEVIVEKNRGRNQLNNEFILICKKCDEQVLIGKDGVDIIINTATLGVEGKIYIGGEKHFSSVVAN